MTLEDLTDYCEIKDCKVRFGNPEVGYVTVDGSGVVAPYNNYRRFLAFHELDHLADARRALQAAQQFRVFCDDGEHVLDRPAFEQEVRLMQRLVGAA